MITIQELHLYQSMVDSGVAPAFYCINDPDHGRVITWSDENDSACFICLACDTKRYLGLNQIEKIKKYIN